MSLRNLESPASSHLFRDNEGTPSHGSKEMVFGNHQVRSRKWYLQKKVIAAVALALILIFLLIFLPVFFIFVHNKHGGGGEAVSGLGPIGSGGSGVPNPGSPSGATSGASGSSIKLANGTTFVYKNPFGGYWVQDPGDPFNNNARPNSWSPPLNTSWKWGTNRIHGVNLGGWLVLEPFITPDIFQRYPNARDEYTLSQAMAADTANGGLNQLERHYDTFITEQDIAEITGSGLNFLRIPIGFWAIETWDGEPFLGKTSWKYFLRVLEWARKYGLRVCLDLHTVPGSQNGLNHSGRLSPVNFVYGNMGLANAERTLYYIRILTEFISQPQYRNLIPIFGIVNEALIAQIGADSLTSFYLKAHDMIRNITGLGEGNGPYIAIHDGFQPLSTWDGFLAGSDRIILDEHPYFAFGGVNLAPMAVLGDTGLAGGQWPRSACDNWGPSTNQTRKNFGVTIAGEFSASPNDCGFYLRGVGAASTNPQCPDYDNWETYTDLGKQGLTNFVLASMDALGDWFFWTWKIGPNGQTGKIEAPLWSYQLGLRNGWIPTDPRAAAGMCQKVGATPQDFDGNYQPWQTGTPSGIPASSSAKFPWPPVTVSGAQLPISLLPTYTNTAAVVTLPPAIFTAAAAKVTQPINGWFNAKDTEGGITPVAGCPYPDEYFGLYSTIPMPTQPCTGPGSAPTPTPTPPPA